ncbi:hypothetical protein FEM48_Zijuj07G0166300 [Ziziphus jujuba var. spinosa]|uniref:Uncharacterized protein n=1 Tax=Ziziphus jujuba var. spinosa TaxID=714518 RepID=A0A978V5R6_ZIZJJ|nr:hypothetical protein FEM48_Zijuj07G0166300 [Ziziphus jujuba var. spinosa]
MLFSRIQIKVRASQRICFILWSPANCQTYTDFEDLIWEVKRNDKSMSNLAQLLDSSAQNTAKMVGVPTNGNGCKLILTGRSLEWSDALEKSEMLEAGHDDDMGTEAELKRGHTILNKLENVCLLEGGCNSKSTILIEAGQRLREIPGEEKWEVDLTKISLMENCTSNIPTSASPKCPRLTTLILNDIENLPTSIGDLVNLTALCLVSCSRLQNVPSLENLKSLRRLNLRWAGVRYLGIRALEKGTLVVRGQEVVKLGKLEIFHGKLYDIHDFNTYARWQKNNKGGPKN